MITPNNRKETNNFIAFESSIQAKLDEVYKDLGYIPIRDNPNKMFDLQLKIEGRFYKTEEKIRQISTYDDFLVGIVQDLVSGGPGWFTTTGCDCLSYVLCKNSLIQLIYLVQWQRFKDWFVVTHLPAHKKGSYIYSGRGYGATINIPVLWSDIPSSLYKQIIVDTNYKSINNQVNQPELKFLNMAQKANV